MKQTILTTNSSRHLKMGNGKLDIGRFPDDEVLVVLKEDVEGKKVFIVGSTDPPAENILELLFTIDTVNMHGADSINVFIPYFGYGKSDREKVPGQVVSSRLMLRLLDALGGEMLNVYTIDPHSIKKEESLKMKLVSVSAMELLAENFKGKKDLKVASPDEGGITRTEEFAGYLDGTSIIKIKKKRLSHSKAEVTEIEGDTDGCDVVIVDDMVQSRGTIEAAVKILKQKGARNIYLAITHMVYSAGGYKKLEVNKSIIKVVTTNTIMPIKGLSQKFEILDISSMLKKLIHEQ